MTAMTNTRTLEGRVALITGATHDGIGRATARRLAAAGASVVLHGSSDTSARGLEEGCRLVAQAGGKAAFEIADLGSDSERATLVERAASHFGPISILVNNAAAITAYAPASKIDLPAREAIFEINFHAPIDLIQQALPAMREAGWGRIINLSSNSTRPPDLPMMGPPKLLHTLALYGASKSALDRYTVGLAAELHGTGISVCGVLPHAVAWVSNADQLARMMLKINPHLVESTEMMAEAIYLVAETGLTGIVSESRAVLQMLQRPLHALDGTTVIGDATSLVAQPTM
jgi:NAD(P)-dependent dehydrogenase (short-subunit alcohol dehydrogenase family)